MTKDDQRMCMTKECAKECAFGTFRRHSEDSEDISNSEDIL